MKHYHLLSFLLLLGACQQSIHQEVEITNGEWFIDSLVQFDFQIDDMETVYNLQYEIDYSVQNYPYHNLYLQSIIQNSKGDTLAIQLQNFILAHPKTGEPYGEATWSSGTFNHQVEAIPAVQFPNPDMYKLTVQQYMRNEPLLGISSLGISLQKINN